MLTTFRGGVLRRKLWRDLRARWGGLLALLAMSAIGVGCFVAFAAVWRDLDGSRERYYRAQQLADFTMDLKRAPRWAVEELVTLPNVREVRGRISLPVSIDLPDQPMPIQGLALSLPGRRRPVLNDVLLRSGVWFSDPRAREVILDDAFAKANHLRPGSRIKVMLLDKQHNLLVTGTAMSPEFVYVLPPAGGIAPDPARYGILYLPERFLQESSDQEGAYNQLVGRAEDVSPVALDNMLDLIERRLEPYGVTNTVPIHELPSARFLRDELLGLKVSARIVPTIFLGVAALVLNVMLSRIIAQQRSIIGTLRAIGYSTTAVMRHYLQFGLAIGILGGLAGWAMGWWLQGVYDGIYNQFYALPDIAPHFYPDIYFLGMGISVFFAVLGTIKGVRHAANLEPAEAMRPPPPERGGRVLPELIPPLWRRLSFRWKMILRTVFRNPFRSTVSLLASLVATSLIVMTLSMNDSMTYMMEFEYEHVSHQDTTVSLREPASVQGRGEFGRLPGVSAAEPQLVVPCDLVNGPHEKRMGVTGLPRGHRLYTPLDKTEHPVQIPSEGLILSRKLAEILHVRPGDVIRLRPLIAHRREVAAPVVGLVDTYLGLAAYCDLDYLSRLLGEDRVANVYLGREFRGAERAPLLKELKRRPGVIGIAERMRSFMQLEETFGKMMRTMLAVMIFFAGLIAFGSVLNATLVSLSERRRDVGSLRVLGYEPGQIARIFSGECFLLNGVGILIGLFGGIGLAHLLALAYNTELYRMPAIVLPVRLAQTTLIMLAFVGAAQSIIYVLIRRLDWLEAVKIKE